MNTIAKAVGLVFLGAVLSLAFSAEAAAQVHSAGAAGSIHSAPIRSGGGIRPAGRVGTPLQPNFAPLYTVPGLSFDIRSLAAASRPGFGRRRGQYVSPFLWYYPFYSPYADYSYEVQPPYEYPQQEAQPAPSPAPAAPSEEPSVSAELQPPPPDVGQFVLVRLDGQVIFVSAFMAVDGRITYVTREGVRRSFPISELDKQATRQINEANGTDISLPD